MDGSVGLMSFWKSLYCVVLCCIILYCIGSNCMISLIIVVTVWGKPIQSKMKHIHGLDKAVY